MKSSTETDVVDYVIAHVHVFILAVVAVLGFVCGYLVRWLFA